MEFKCKVSLIGNERVGKTSLILRYINNTFSEEYMTTLGADFVDKNYTRDDIGILKGNDSFNLVLWDMAGQSHFKDVASIYCEGSAGIIIVFDISDKESFEALPDWIQFADKVAKDALRIIVGNKTDLPMAISEAEIKKMEKRIKTPIRLVSAKMNLEEEDSNVQDVFTTMATDLVIKFQKQIEDA
ncbi:hypothetical protein NEF87_004000 [Candidatus Lokiarchaeum ossiferum]|uniref:GTP-binding protein n=1 Tax=Candidatus Lokiarchaeum ossiferum TaxID=2951803 RepID=A0ABY6HW30_9ARCH|nr:hypothetical protein NEF87_004000 [Candidatus Lokiarchaeum sp. B-35]